MTSEARFSPRQTEAERNDHALLEAAKSVLATEGAHASVAAIAKRAGVGIGSLYRRYRTKEELFRHLLDITLDQYLTAAHTGLQYDDPWKGLVHYVTSVLDFGPGSLAPIAGTITLTAEIEEKNARSDAAVASLVERAHDAGVLRPDATALDVELLVEQLGKSPLLEQLGKQGRTDLTEAALNARARITAIALDGLRNADHPRLPGDPPGYELFEERWRQEPPAANT